MGYRTYNASSNRVRSPGDDLRSYEERIVQEALAGLSLPFQYECKKLDYVLRKKYTPDFSVDGVHVEVKGWWPPEDRAKLKAVRLGNPDDVLVVILVRPETKISKTSKTTYAEWCDKWGISWVPFNKDPDVIRQWVENVLSKFINRVHSAPAQMVLLTESMEVSSASCATSPAGPAEDQRNQSPIASDP
jgi:hypothetical protein